MLLLILFTGVNCIAQTKKSSKEPQSKVAPAMPIALEKELEVFNNDTLVDIYRISLCADVPNNKKPMDVFYRTEAGHVFLILQKINTTDTLNKVFGFYPLRGLPIFFSYVKSNIRDNSKREYDIAITKVLTKEAFLKVINLSLQFAKKKYHLNKYNCYDYAINIFNAVAGDDTLPRMRLRYPLFYGKGGSPCSIYKYIKQQKESALATNILYGNLIAPASTKVHTK